MKKQLFQFTNFVLIYALVITASLFPAMTFAQTDTSLDQQKADCEKNSAYEWSPTKNRCVQKAEAQNARHDVENCATITDIEQRKACHIREAEKKTSLNSDPNSLPDGNTDKSAVINSAYAVLGIINSLGSGNKNSSCTSKTIFAYTALAGIATDIWLKIDARKKLDALKNKYQIELKNSAYDAQVKAFEYLKEEQQTVKDIASKEKKRNQLLMLGYGAASLMAIYEMATSTTTSANCYKKEAQEEKKPEPKSEPAPAAEQPAPAASPAPEQAPAATPAPEQAPAPAPAPAPAEPTTATVAPQTVEQPPATAPQDKYVVTGSGQNMRVRGVDANGNYNGTAIVTHGNSSYVINDSTGSVIGPVSSNANISWRDGRSQQIPSYLVSPNSITGGTNNIRFNGTTEMNIDGRSYRLNR